MRSLGKFHSPEQYSQLSSSTSSFNLRENFNHSKRPLSNTDISRLPLVPAESSCGGQGCLVLEMLRRPAGLGPTKKLACIYVLKGHMPRTACRRSSCTTHLPSLLQKSVCIGNNW